MRQRPHALLLTAAAVATASLWSTGALADPTPTPTPTADADALPIAVTLGGVSPLAPQPGDKLIVDGTLTDQAESPVSNLSIQLLVSPTKLGSKGEFDGYASTPAGAPPADAIAASTQTTVLSRTSLDIGTSEPFSVTVPVDDLHLPQPWQVYEMAVVVGGDTVTGHTTVGQLRTFLPWAPLGVPGVGDPTQLAWTWPIVDRPHRSDSSTWLDDDLAASFTGDGRLARLVAAGDRAEQQSPPPPPKPRKHKHRHGHRRTEPPTRPQPTVRPVPVTWVIDPQLLDDASAMTSHYEVNAANNTTKAGRGSSAAKQWLAQLKQAVGRGSVFGLPYGDPDDVAAVRAGLGTEVQLANGRGNQLIESTLGSKPLPYAWPPNGMLDERTLDTLFAAGETTVVLDSDALPVIGGPPSVTPGAHATIRSRDGNFDVNALLADDTLNEVVDTGAHSDSEGPFAEQRLLSELLMIQAEHPFDQRSFVITPSRRWAPSASYADKILSATGQVPWVEPVSLSQIADGPIDRTVQREPLTFTPEDRELLLPRTYVNRVRRLKSLVDAFVAIVPRGDPTAGGFNDGLLRLLSSAWRADPVSARTTRVTLLDKVVTTRGKVHIASHKDSLITLTSHSGTVPVTIANDLDTPVHIVVQVEPDQHLVVKSGARTVRTIGAHRLAPVDVRAAAQTSGVFRLTVRLETPPPLSVHYGPAIPLRIRSTAYGATALLITGGATAVLLLTVIVRLVRRARAARRATPIPT